eukprot:9208-Heterococcus_DN1.PRE.1
MSDTDSSLCTPSFMQYLMQSSVTSMYACEQHGSLCAVACMLDDSAVLPVKQLMTAMRIVAAACASSAVSIERSGIPSRSARSSSCATQ